MSLVLNTNINSLIAQNSLASSGNQLATALQQLSSGLRINTAADDAGSACEVAKRELEKRLTMLRGISECNATRLD